MNLRSVDLNLLVIFDALMLERHVTRAAARIGMTQPATSNALARLRHTFGDELFIREPGGMAPTARARELEEPVRAILRQAERLMTTDLGFEPARVRRDFTVRMSDLLGQLLLPRICGQLASAAPGISLNIVHRAPQETFQSLEADTVDLAVGMELGRSSAIHSEILFEDRMCCVMSRRNPLAAKRLTMKRFLDAAHLKVSMSPTDIRFVDNVLARMGLQRRVIVNLPHWLLVPAVLRESPLLAVVSTRLAQQFATADADVVARPLPFESDPFSWTLYWHRRYEQSAAHRWLRGVVRDAA